MQWKSVGPGAAATVVADEKEMPEISGKTLYYLSPGWDPHHIWMVLDEDWGWQRVLFQTVDAVAERYEASDISIIDGQEVKTWTKLSRADKRGSTERYAPANDALPSSSTPQSVPGGWNHEYCQFCRRHINNGDFGYRDGDDQWLCQNCYDKYVTGRDLSFVEDL